MFVSRYLEELGRTAHEVNYFYRDMYRMARSGDVFDRFLGLPSLIATTPLHYPILLCYGAVRDAIPRAMK